MFIKILEKPRVLEYYKLNHGLFLIYHDLW